MNDSQFRHLLDRFGYSWSGYRKVRKGVKKRLGRHMQEAGCRSEAVNRNLEVRVQFECVMTVSISRFFRDRGLWRDVREGILPVLAKSPHGVKVWSAGCASGEEVYSFNILWGRLRRDDTHLPDLSILATDLCPAYLERARAAVYPPGSLREVPETIRSACFEKTSAGEYALKSEIKEGIEWRVHDLLLDPPGNTFDLIFLRNSLLTYYKDEIKIPALAKVVDCLSTGGFLIVGSHEVMPIGPPTLSPWRDSPYILQVN